VDRDDAEPTVGRTGARFGGGSRRRKAKRRGPGGQPTSELDTEALAAVPGAEAEGKPDHAPDDGFVVYRSSPVGLTGARFGGAPRDRSRSVQTDPPDLEEGPINGPSAGSDPAGADPASTYPYHSAESPLSGFGAEAGAVEGPTSFVRPYVLTRGRTRSQYELSIETLVSAVPMAASGPAAAEHEAVIALCQEPRSVAEVAALLGVPLGVARVILGDLVAAGAVAVHRTAGVAGPDLALMERVLAGLRRL
jgi:Protein of unknown function (DUF742)